MNFHRHQATFERSISIPVNSYGSFTSFQNRVKSALIPGPKVPVNETAALTAGRVWHWIRNVALYSFQQLRLRLIFTAQIVPVKIFLPTACWHSTQNPANASGIFKQHIMTCGIVTMDLHRISSL